MNKDGEELDLHPLWVPHPPLERVYRNQYAKNNGNRLVGGLNLVVPQSVKQEELARWGGVMLQAAENTVMM